MASNAAEARRVAEAIIGMQLVTHQTGPEGQKVKQVLVEKASDIDREFYLGITLDRAQSKLVVMASSEGGVEIEEVAANWDMVHGAGFHQSQRGKRGGGLGVSNHKLIIRT